MLETDSEGRPLNNSGCVFWADGEVVKQTTISMSSPNHNMGVLNFVRELQKQRKAEGLPDLTIDQQNDLLFKNYVPLVIRGRGDNVEVCIRPDTGVERAVQTAELLEDNLGIPSDRVKIIEMGESRLVDEFKRRGMLWRIYPKPKTPEEESRFIEDSLARTAHEVEVYYSPSSGERFLTVENMFRIVNDFRGGEENRRKLVDRLSEITELASRKNRSGNRELSFFMWTRKTST